VALLDVLGAKYLVMPREGGGVIIERVKDLDGLHMVRGIGQSRVAVFMLLDANGNYRRAVLVLTESGTCSSVSLTDADNGDLPDAVTPSGLVIRPVDNALEVTDPISGATETLANVGMTGGCWLAGLTGVFYATQDAVIRVTMVK
jgi:hypothetical protein